MAGGLRGRHPGSSAVIGGASCVYVCGLGCICGPAAPSAELLSLFGSDPEHRVGLHRRVPFQLCLGVGRGLGAQLLKTEQSSADASVSCDPAAKAREVDFDFDIRCCSCARGQSRRCPFGPAASQSLMLEVSPQELNANDRSDFSISRRPRQTLPPWRRLRRRLWQR